MKRARKIKGEGWDVSECLGSMDGDMQIQRIDDPERSGVQLKPAFASDTSAIRHVLRLAKEGDEQALDALWDVLDEDDLVNRILWADAMGWRSVAN